MKPVSPSTPNPVLRWFSVGLVVAISIAFYSTAGLSVRENTLANDFLGFYAAGMQLQAGDGARLHDPVVQKQYQAKVDPEVRTVVPFPRPRYYAEVFRPLALLPERTALNVWQAIQFLALLGTWALLIARYRAEILMLTAFFLPLPIGIGHGQDTGWMALLAAASLFLWQGGYPAWAGVVLALCLFKWHLVLLAPVAMLLGRQWSMLKGFTAMAILTLILDFALDGPAGWRAYIELLGMRDLEHMTPGLTLMPNLQGLFANLAIPDLWWLGLAVALVSFVMCAIRLPWPRALVAAQLCAVLAVPHSFEYDLAFILFPLVALLSDGVQGARKWSAFLLLVPPLYFALLFSSPWPGLLPLCSLCLLVSLAWEGWRTPPFAGPQ